jgi:hypothetical protein
MRTRTARLLAVIGVAVFLFSWLTPAVVMGQERNAPLKWEYRAIAFGGGEIDGTKKLNDLGAEGWEYVGPLANGLVAFRRPAKASRQAAARLPKAVYLMAGEARPPTKEQEKHPEVLVVHCFEALERAASKRTAVWIDAGAIGLLGDKGKEWVIRKGREKYPFVLVGYNDALYSFREQLDCFLISGPGPIDWTQHQLTPGFSVIMLEEKKLKDGGIEVSGPMQGYKQEPTFDAILAVTNRLLAGESVPESP